jgi:hypothetical protein
LSTQFYRATHPSDKGKAAGFDFSSLLAGSAFANPSRSASEKPARRTKTFYLRQAILEHLDDLEDLFPAGRTFNGIRIGEEGERFSSVIFFSFFEPF